MRAIFISLILLSTYAGVSNKTACKRLRSINKTNAAFVSVSAPYMPTGFYFLADGLKGVKMPLKDSKKIYMIAPAAFASVKNVINTKFEKTPTDRGVYTELCLTFDVKGTRDLEEGTGNPLHPKIAVVLANQLFYVVDNQSKIKTGVMCIGIEGYSEKEMIALKDAIDHKR